MHHCPARGDPHCTPLSTIDKPKPHLPPHGTPVPCVLVLTIPCVLGALPKGIPCLPSLMHQDLTWPEAVVQASLCDRIRPRSFVRYCGHAVPLLAWAATPPHPGFPYLKSVILGHRFLFPCSTIPLSFMCTILPSCRSALTGIPLLAAVVSGAVLHQAQTGIPQAASCTARRLICSSTVGPVLGGISVLRHDRLIYSWSAAEEHALGGGG